MEIGFPLNISLYQFSLFSDLFYYQIKIYIIQHRSFIISLDIIDKMSILSHYDKEKRMSKIENKDFILR